MMVFAGHLQISKANKSRNVKFINNLFLKR